MLYSCYSKQEHIADMELGHQYTVSQKSIACLIFYYLKKFELIIIVFGNLSF